MTVMDIVMKSEIARKSQWSVSKYMRDLISESTLYSIPEELERPKIKIGVGVLNINKSVSKSEIKVKSEHALLI
jgi:hypothetical protein